MAVREFNGSTDELNTAAGALSAMTSGTIAYIVKWSGSAWRTVFGAHTSSDVGWIQVGLSSSGNNFFYNGNTLDSTGTLSNGTWYFIVVRKDAGSANVRYSIYDFSSETWQHLEGANTHADADNPPGASGTIRFDYDDAEPFNGRIAVRAAWSNTLAWSADSSGDTAIEAAGLETALSSWVDAEPDALWRFNQASVTESVDDLTGGGADQTSRTGTSVITGDDPPDFSFDLNGAVTGVASADLGALTGTATGQRLTYGTATADLAALVSSATGQRLTYGSAEADLGTLDASAQASTLVLGVAVADLGQLGASANGKVSLFGTATADLGALTAHARSSVLILGVASANLSGVTAHADGLGTPAQPRFILRGPTFDENLWTSDRFFIRYRLPRGITLVVSGVQVIELTYPYQADLAQYDRVYLGGRDHRITGAERELLVDAGYEDFIFPIEDLEQ